MGVAIKDLSNNITFVYKSDSLLMKIINWFLLIITFGKLNQFMEHFTTTIGRTIYLPNDWNELPPEQRDIIIEHEKVHMKQKERYGIFLFSILYLFIPLPIGLAYFRMKFEKEAYEVTIKKIIEYYGVKAVKKEFFIRCFSSASYFWMWPFKYSIGKWVDEMVVKHGPKR